jgi:competence protein ComEC
MKKYLANWQLIIVSLLFLSNFFVWYLVSKADSRILTVSFLNVGQGDAILIEAPNGNQVLIDGGPGRKILSELGQALPFYDRSIDLIIVTHPDSDHIGGLPLVLKNYAVVGFLEPEALPLRGEGPGVICDTAICEALETAVTAEGAQKITAHRGQVIQLGRGAELEILSPVGPMAGKDTNSASVVAKLTYGATSFLFTGDAPQATERQLIFADGKNLDIEVLKVGHHGSDTSSAPEFLAATSPEVAVISVGADNRYGHPKTSVLDSLAKIGAKILRTDQQGRIEITSDGEKLF